MEFLGALLSPIIAKLGIWLWVGIAGALSALAAWGYKKYQAYQMQKKDNRIDELEEELFDKQLEEDNEESMSKPVDDPFDLD